MPTWNNTSDPTSRINYIIVDGYASVDDARSHIFGSLRGTNEYEKISVIFITGRNQPPLDDIDRQARAVFVNLGSPLSHDDLETLPTEQVEYWLSDRSPHKPSAITRNAFSGPRTEAIQGQIREAETAQAIARLRLYVLTIKNGYSCCPIFQWKCQWII